MKLSKNLEKLQKSIKEDSHTTDKQFHDYKKFRQMLDNSGLEFKKDHYSIPPMDKIYRKL